MERLRILTGQTASGKSVVAVCLAKATGAEIISVDSMKVYRGLDIGTAKPSLASREVVPFHMIDVVDPQESFSLAGYLDGARTAAYDVKARGRHALFVGGTPLYMRGLLYGIFDGPCADWALRAQLKEQARRSGPGVLHDELRKVDPVTATRLHPNDMRRVIRALEVVRKTGRPISAHQRQYPAPKAAVPYRMAALRRSDADLQGRIRRRTDRMFAAGLVDEVRRALARGELCRSVRKAIGYREVIACLNGEFSLDEAARQIVHNTWRLARKQRTWLKSFPSVEWLDVQPDETPEETAARAKALLFGPELLN